MPLAPGARLGVFEVRSTLGVGGMGEVYRAHDTSLGRDVALKILPEAFATHPGRLARFEREAHILASLDHANIATVYGLADAGELRALVMELVEGPNLAERIAAGPLPVGTALPIARQIAEALQCAHEKRIDHRDLKPANLKLRADGAVKVLDFGLAKALEAGGGDSDPDAPHAPATLTAPGATQAGDVLGTAAYMSPEQARGEPVDPRADLWAFGVVLYEMPTGTRPFAGRTMADALARIIFRDGREAAACRTGGAGAPARVPRWL
ncbi:MAG: serine/threonine-protein kinase [Vicinamibacterales bacterium]